MVNWVRAITLSTSLEMAAWNSSISRSSLRGSQLFEVKVYKTSLAEYLPVAVRHDAGLNVGQLLQRGEACVHAAIFAMLRNVDTCSANTHLWTPSHMMRVAPQEPGGMSPLMKESNSAWGRLRLAAVRLSMKLRAQQRLVK